jgi:putative serine protease PepD
VNKNMLTIVPATLFAAGLAASVSGLAFGGDRTGAAAAPPALIASAAGGAVQTPEQVYQSAAQGVVVITAIETEKIPRTASTPPLTARVLVLGSGFVIDAQGDIATNAHVVQGGKRIRVGFSSGAKYPATIVGSDVSSDVAVVHVNAPASVLHPLAFGDSAAVQVGDPAYAIGNPLGLDRTMTAGIISATGRDIRAPNGRTIPNAIQTDAPINHGNSGGPLLDRYGHVVGINDQIASGSAGGGSIGIGFAISSARAISVANRLIASGHAKP